MEQVNKYKPLEMDKYCLCHLMFCYKVLNITSDYNFEEIFWLRHCNDHLASVIGFIHYANKLKMDASVIYNPRLLGHLLKNLAKQIFSYFVKKIPTYNF